MLSVRKHLEASSNPNSERITLRFEILDKEGAVFYRVELGAFRPGNLILRLVDSENTVVAQESDTAIATGQQIIYRVQNLSPGSYFIEVDDGFFIQVKEVKV